MKNIKLLLLICFMLVIPWGLLLNQAGIEMQLIGLSVQIIGLFLMVIKRKQLF